MRIKFYAHASFRIEGSGLAIVTDPYTPGPDGSRFDPIHEPADMVIRSSPDDRFHNDPSHVLGDPVVVDALDIPPEGAAVKGIDIRAYPVMESTAFDYGRPERDNAMYSFALDGIRVLHIGDIGNAFTEEHLDALAGNVDLMLALAGGHATIALDDLDTAINAIQPRVIIPMHYYHSRGKLDILPVTEFTDRHPKERVVWVGSPELELTPETLPTETRIYVLEQCR